MTISNLIFTAIVLPLNSIAIMSPQWVFEKSPLNVCNECFFFFKFANISSNGLPDKMQNHTDWICWTVSFSNPRYIQDRPFCCASFAFLFYWSFATLLFMEAALAVNRWAAVCTTNLRWNDIYGDYHDYGMADHMVLDGHWNCQWWDHHEIIK